MSLIFFSVSCFSFYFFPNYANMFVLDQFFTNYQIYCGKGRLDQYFEMFKNKSFDKFDQDGDILLILDHCI